MRRGLGICAALALLAASTACTAASTAGSAQTVAIPAPRSATTPSTTSSPTSPSPSPSTTSAARSTSRSTSPAASPPTSAATTQTAATALPLDYSTGSARQVITVVAASHRSTTATLQAWRRAGSHWAKVGAAVPAWLGSGGIGQASEQSSATPAGSFTLTEAFGRDADPGTALPYRRTTPADWWISQPGPLYNTEQRCVSACPFAVGAPNEHLYYATPFYEYAVVIDYNRFPVRQGAGSAFFLHVTVGEPTEGCVSIGRDQLVRIMRWLSPAAHPRILMGVG